MQITAKKIRPYFKILSIVAVLATAAVIFWFLKYYFYPAITGSQTIYALQKNMAAEVIDVTKFNALLEKSREKTKLPSNTDFGTDPFVNK
jgi:hypothetical protein